MQGRLENLEIKLLITPRLRILHKKCGRGSSVYNSLGQVNFLSLLHYAALFFEAQGHLLFSLIKH